MEFDVATLKSADALESDLCIVGAGPAGLVLACAFLGSRHQVLLIESGGLREDLRVQQMNRSIVDADPNITLEKSRYRAPGGTVRLWNTPYRDSIGAKYLPLDTLDFETRDYLEGSGWPFSRAALDSYYRRAHEVCGIGPFDYGEAVSHSSELGAPPPWNGSDILRSRFYRLGAASVFMENLVGQVRAAPNITLICSASVESLQPDRSSSRIDAITANTLGGMSLRIRAQVFALAGGGVENARLLLASGVGGSLVGRHFMEHPRDYSLVAVPDQRSSYVLAAMCDSRETPLGNVVRGRLAIDGAFLLREGLLNASVSLFPMVTTRTSRMAATLKRSLSSLKWAHRGRADTALPSLQAPGYPNAPEGWSRESIRLERFAGLRILINLEQAPHPDNRIVLGDRRNPLGGRMAALHWRWREADARNLSRLHEVLKRELPRAGFGRIESINSLKPEPNAHHHAGTTRMSEDAARGVVDADSRVHGIENLFVAGSSVFPTAGFANPTLTIVALALRLGDHLRQRMGDD